ncbi:hypothetical protein GOBAR_DD02044 [Gossypium barbadense]|nr:hypothetical protein GOBAR_DD02044 [Gossypium barbadense]
MKEMMTTMVKGKAKVGEGSDTLDNPIPFYSDTGYIVKIYRFKCQLEIREGVKANEINTLDAKLITIVYGKKTIIENESPLKAVQDDLLVIRVLDPFKYGDDQRVPWRYDYEVAGCNASNVSRLSGITRIGSCYKPNIMGKEPRVRKGWQIHLGLGKDIQGISKPIFVPTQKDIRGLGYKPTREDVERMCKEWRAKRLACMARKKVVEPPLICPPLSETFYSVGFEHQERTSVKLMINGDAVDLNMIGNKVLMSGD